MALDSLQRNPLFPNYPFRLPQPNPFLPQKLQDFDYFVVVDFEATCDKKIPHPQEIIDFPSVIVTGVTGQITHMGVTPTNFAVVTWSDWDCQVMLESECRFKNIPKPSYFNRWINLRVPFSKVFGDVRCNLKEAVELGWHGRVHCGLDDSMNIARLLAVIMQRGFKFSITKSLTPPQDITQDSVMTWNRHHQFLVRQRKCTFQHTSRDPAEVEEFRYCFCGAKSFKKIIRKPGPKCGSFFFGCGNLTPNKGACCNYFHSATA
ncbi:hypothetical protein WN944_021646 [Citrus x changshan-huyou]|uniref:Exonuclease domain-containing protein n=1 Tax=Citrus x changshan-huyou TaxID=2935761 RepID=A0AAP0MX57_9ROSI